MVIIALVRENGRLRREQDIHCEDEGWFPKPRYESVRGAQLAVGSDEAENAKNVARWPRNESLAQMTRVDGQMEEKR